MSNKRQAMNDLNHNNWNDEEEPEERGTYRIAPQEELSKRVIKTARRKVTSSGFTDGADANVSSSIFGKFKGFVSNTSGNTAAVSTSSAGASKFDFLSKIPSVAASAAAIVSSAADTPAANKPMFNFSGSAHTSTTATASSSAVATAATKNANTAMLPDSSSSDGNNAKSANQQFQARVKGLNIAVRDWIVENLEKTPICILTPIFRDYERLLKDLQKERDEMLTGKTTTNATASTKVSSVTPGPNTVFGTAMTNIGNLTSTAAGTPAIKFDFGAKASSAEKPTSSAGFSFSSSATNDVGSTSNSANATNGFNFSGNPTKFSFGYKTEADASQPKDKTTAATTGFNFFSGVASSTNDKAKTDEGNAAVASAVPFFFKPLNSTQFAPADTKSVEKNETDAATASVENNDEEEEEPIKVEFKQVVEEDAIYSKRCKVFVKKSEAFVDRGVGTLYLKPIKNSEKVQLIVRADTNLGNILINIILSEAIPAQRTGKNNVMLVCLPTPEDEKATPTLLRVKTAEEANELFDIIQKYRK